jgi:hypothetical protein
MESTINDWKISRIWPLNYPKKMATKAAGVAKH